MSKAKIVLIDDEPDTIELMKAFLELYEFEVVGATDGQTGMEAVDRHNPALLLLDVMLPDKDGFTICEELRGQPETANLPVVLVTALTSWSDQRRGFQVGCDRYIRKPLDLHFLLGEIRTVLSERADKKARPMSVIYTPDDWFDNLPDFPFEPHYVEIGGLRVHYVDQGAGDNLILCLHGEPSWSYLYRKMIPPLSAQHRVIAPDFVGFGRSAKYTDKDAYSFQMHLDTLTGFIEALDLRQITVVVQDWGGLIGLTAAARLPDRFARLVIMNTGLPTGDEPMPRAFLAWQKISARAKDLPVGKVIQQGTVGELPPELIAAYEAPFPDASYKAGASIWPSLVPTQPDQPGAAELRSTREKLSQWDKPALVMFSDGDPITRGGDRFFRDLIPTARAQPEITITAAGHFLQEDKGEEIARHILDFIDRTI